MTRTSKLWLVPVVLLQAAFFLYVSQRRLIDGDEGFYLLASQLVMRHHAPYLDFFYTQAPLLPYVYAAWFKVAGVSWISARVFCALISTWIGGLIYVQVCRETGKWLAGAVAVLVYASSAIVFAWFPIVKTFPLAAAFLFPAYMILAQLPAATSRWLVALSGVLFGLAVDTRSYVVGLLPLLLWWIWRQQRERAWMRMAWFCGGFVVGLLPSLALFVTSPDAFLFNNLGYHAMRSQWGLIGNLRNKLKILSLLAIGGVTGFQFAVAGLTGLLGVILVRPRKAPSFLALLIAIALGLVSLLPTPSFVQYFSILMPFSIVAGIGPVAEFFANLRSRRRLAAAAACVALMTAYVGLAAIPFRQYLFTGSEVPGIFQPEQAQKWTLAHVTNVSRTVDKLAHPGEQVLSFWPGFLVGTQAEPVPGFENDFGDYVSHYLTLEQRERYHILTRDEMLESFARHDARLIVIGNQGSFSGGPEVNKSARAVEQFGYRLVGKVDDTMFYECCAR
jgi:Dolichyl-phosphate-mannose-protein mannosyltransferase